METSYSLDGIHLPENRKLVQLLTRTSLAICIAVILMAVIFALGFIPYSSHKIDPFTLLAFIGLATSLIIVGLQKKINKSIIVRLLSLCRWICNVFVITVGGWYVLSYINQQGGDGVVLIVGLKLISLGTALSLSLVKTIHRFHLVQLLILIVLIFSSVTVLGHIYQFFFHLNTHSIATPLIVGLLFFFLCLGAFLRWPTRGFVGLLTTDSLSAIFAIRMLVITIFSISIIGIFALGGVSLGIYSLFEAVAIFAVLLMVFITGLIWINTKLLYKSELKNFFLSEELRVHSISLGLSNEDLAEKMAQLEKTNMEYIDKLNSRNKYAEVVDSEA